MRPGQNKRMRGRNNRRGPNPLTRSYESNGPDVKVRGTAQHIAEKYTQLARDAHVSGDPVAAESYLQHAEHYYRLISSAHQAQLAIQNGTADDRDDEDDDFDTASDRFTFRPVQQQNQQPGQPAYQGEGGETGEAGEGDDSAPQGQERQGHERQNQDRGGQDRAGGRGDRHHNDRRNGRPDRNQDRNFRPGGERNPDRGGFNPARPQRRPPADLEGAEQPVLPAFLTAPVRAIPIEGAEAAAPRAPEAAGGDLGPTQFRARRRRRGRAEGDDLPLEPETSGSDQT